METNSNSAGSYDLKPSESNNTLNDSLFDMFNFSPPELQESVSPKRKHNDVSQAPPGPKARNKLSLLKSSQRTVPTMSSCTGGSKVSTKNRDDKEKNAYTSPLNSEKLFESDAELFSTQTLRKIDQESMEFEEKKKENPKTGKY